MAKATPQMSDYSIAESKLPRRHMGEMHELIHPAGPAVVTEIFNQFARLNHRAREEGTEVAALLPSTGVIQGLIKAAFWTSLRREEGTTPRLSLAYVSPAQAAPSLHFERPIPLHPHILTRLAPAIERPGIFLGVCMVDGQLQAWGVASTIPSLSCVVEIVSPGVLMIKQRHDRAFSKFINVALLEGDRVKILDYEAATLPDWPHIIKSFVNTNEEHSTKDETLIRLALSMRAHGRGGSLLVVPPGSTAWRESISSQIPYVSDPPSSELAELVRSEPAEQDAARWRQTLDRAVDFVGGLTAVDGAMVIDEDFNVLAFGAKIIRRRGSPPLEQLAIAEPIKGAELQIVHPARLGGSRHLFAAQFASDQSDALALVASHDGPFTLFVASRTDGMVHGYRVDSLLL